MSNTAVKTRSPHQATIPAVPQTSLTPSTNHRPGLALLRGVSRSFYLSIRLLPPTLREPIGLAYLLARATDTLADTATLPAAQRQASLAQLTRAIAGDAQARQDLPSLMAAFTPLQQDPAERALIEALPACLDWLDAQDGADRDDIRTVLGHITRGQMLDVERFGSAAPGKVVALADAAELDEYTYLVAGCVGEFWTRLGRRHVPAFSELPDAELMALGRQFGQALQLVNILRDLAADVAAGRCYLPADALAAAGLAPHTLLVQPLPPGALNALSIVWRPWRDRAGHGTDQGMRYALSLRSRRVRAATALPALLAARTLALLDDAGPGAPKVKVPRAEVRATLLRMALTLAARGTLSHLYRG